MGRTSALAASFQPGETAWQQGRHGRPQAGRRAALRDGPRAVVPAPPGLRPDVVRVERIAGQPQPFADLVERGG